MIVRSSREMAQFLEGLDTLHIASLMKVHPSAMRQLFTHTSAHVTSRELAELLVPIFSPRGSNVREDGVRKSGLDGLLYRLYSN